jgi:hypothetical protein
MGVYCFVCHLVPGFQLCSIRNQAYLIEIHLHVQGEDFAFASASAMAEATGKASCDGKVRSACCRANT